MRVKVIHTESGSVRMLSENLANDKVYMAKQGFVKAEVKKVAEEKPVEITEEQPKKKKSKK